MRRSRTALVSALACGLALAACGKDADRPAGEAPATSAAPATPTAPPTPTPTPTPAAPPAPATTPKPEREVIDPTDEAMHRAQRLGRRDAPKAVGEVAPAVPGLPEKTLAVIVFFRGEW